MAHMPNLDTPDGFMAKFAYERKRPVEGSVGDMLKAALDSTFDFVPLAKKAHFRITRLLYVIASKADPLHFPNSDRRGAFLPAGLKPMLRFVVDSYQPNEHGLFPDAYHGGLVQLTRKTVAKATGIHLTPYEFHKARKLLIHSGLLMSWRTMLKDAQRWNGCEFWVRLVMPEFKRLVDQAYALGKQGPDWFQHMLTETAPLERGMARPRISPEAFIDRHGGHLLVLDAERMPFISEATRFETLNPFGDCINDLLLVLHGKQNRYHRPVDGRKHRVCPQAKDLLKLLVRLVSTNGNRFRHSVPPIVRDGKLYFLVNASWLRDEAAMTQGQYSRELRLFREVGIVEVLPVSKDVLGIAVDFGRIDEICQGLPVWKKEAQLPDLRVKKVEKDTHIHRACKSTYKLQPSISDVLVAGSRVSGSLKQKEKNSQPFGLSSNSFCVPGRPGKSGKRKLSNLKLGAYTPVGQPSSLEQLPPPRSSSPASEYLPSPVDQPPHPGSSFGGQSKNSLDAPFVEQYSHPVLREIIELFRKQFQTPITHRQARQIERLFRSKQMGLDQVSNLLRCISNKASTYYELPDGLNLLAFHGFRRSGLTLDCLLSSWGKFLDIQECIQAKRHIYRDPEFLDRLHNFFNHFAYQSLHYGEPGFGHQSPQLFTLEEWTYHRNNPDLIITHPRSHIPIDPVTAAMLAAEPGGWDPSLVTALREDAKLILYKHPEIYAIIDFWPARMPRRQIFGLSATEARRLRRRGRNAIVRAYWSRFKYRSRYPYLQMKAANENYEEYRISAPLYAEERLLERIDSLPRCLAPGVFKSCGGESD